MTELVQEIRIGQLRGFKDHPFQVKDNEELQALCDSIREYGVLSPCRPCWPGPRRTATRSSPATGEKRLR